MKFWIALLVLFLSGAGVAGGIILDRKVLREHKTIWSPASRPISIMRHKEELGLSDEQKATLETRTKEIDAKEKELSGLRGKLLDILTPEQRAKLNEITWNERSERGKADIERRVTLCKKLFDLTDDQVASLRSALQVTWEKRRDFFVNEAKEMDRQKIDERMAAFQKEQDEKIQKILTPDQFEKYHLIDTPQGHRRGPEGR